MHTILTMSVINANTNQAEQIYNLFVLEHIENSCIVKYSALLYQYLSILQPESNWSKTSITIIEEWISMVQINEIVKHWFHLQ